MPTYEYQCSKCNKVFEAIYKSSSRPKSRKCKFCNYTAKQIISSTSFALKGNGWSADGYSSMTDDQKMTKDFTDIATKGK